MTVALNLNTWVFYFIKIKEMAVINTSKFAVKDYNPRCNEFILNILTILCVAAMLGTEIYFFSHYVSDETPEE